MKISQEVKLFNHFKTVGSITAVEATDLYRIRSLTRRITNLRRAGNKISSVQKVDALGQRYVRYVMSHPGLPRSPRRLKVTQGVVPKAPSLGLNPTYRGAQLMRPHDIDFCRKCDYHMDDCKCEVAEPEAFADKNEADLKELLSAALRALCLTRDYVGEETLPAIGGWEWYDAGKKISLAIPDDAWAEQFALRTPPTEEPAE